MARKTAELNLSAQQAAPRRRALFFVAPAFLALGIAIGWAGKAASVRPATVTQQQSSGCLRLGGYKYVSPLLLCDATPTTGSAKLDPLKQSFQKTINARVADGSLNAASIYFRDLRTRTETSVGGDDKYFPASLKKVPVMMEYLRKSESDEGLLDTKGVLQGDTDFNQGVEIPPSQAPTYGKEYTVRQLMDYMVRYSDNISFQMLSSNLKDDQLNELYRDLQIYYPGDNTGIADYITPFQYSLFFRTLYNGTYLTPDDSEKALSLLAQTEYKNGLVGGVPAGVTVAHKFGIFTQRGEGVLLERELHDCGIVYQENNPYVMCVMTRSNGDLAKAEKAIQELSADAYAAASDDYR